MWLQLIAGNREVSQEPIKLRSQPRSKDFKGMHIDKKIVHVLSIQMPFTALWSAGSFRGWMLKKENRLL